MDSIQDDYDRTDANKAWHAAGCPPPVVPPDELITRTFDKIELEALEWLWPGFIALDFLNLMVGETGASKSTVLADVMARETRGLPLPGDDNFGDGTKPTRPPGRVLLLNSEDPSEILTLPRLMACGADLSRVTEIQGAIRLGQRSTFSMQDDLRTVSSGLATARSLGSPYSLMVIDPITSYLHGKVLRKVEMNDSGQLRTVLEPWTRLAKEQHIAIAGVTHLAKDTTRSMIHRVLGGGAFAQLCRSLPAVVSLPDEGEHEKALLQVKTNLPGVQRGAWRFRTEMKSVGKDKKGREVFATFPIWSHLDKLITPQSLAGGARGPVAQHNTGAAFGLWLKAQFVGAGQEWIRSDTLILAALEAKAVTSRSAWDKKSPIYLDKHNDGGTYWCKLKT